MSAQVRISPPATAARSLRAVVLAIVATAGALAHAATIGTAANTSVSNTATFAYSYVGPSGSVATSTNAVATFLVDRKVDLTLTDHNSAYNSAQVPTPGPSTNPAVLRYTLTNTGNATLDFQVIATDSTDPYGGTDSYDQTASVFVDANGDGTYTAGTDTASFVDELASGSSIAVFVVGTIPSGAINGDISGKLLTATARAGGGASSLGAALTETAGPEAAATMDTVFADAAGATDPARDAALSARDAYKVISTVLGVSKSVVATNDPTNGGSNPKAIPGATLRYTIIVNNPTAAPATAQAVTLTDALPAGVTYVAASITVNGGSAGTDANDGVDASGFDVRQSGGTVTVVLGNMAANTTHTIRFNVTVNAGQAAGNSIANTGSVAYSLSGTPQTPKTSTATFLVDREIKLTLVDHNGAYNSAQTPSPAPGSVNAVLRYTLTNTGNGTQDFSLAVVDTSTPYAGSDNYDQTAALFVDANANGTYESGTDTATFVDELAAGSSKTVFVVGASIALARIDGDISAKLLTATSRAGGTASALGATLTQTAGADTATLVDTVFSDAAGTVDIARDAAIDAKDAFKVVASRLSVTKASFVVTDPVNGSGAGRKRIPGARIRYTMVVTNDAAAAASAASVLLKDLIPVHTSYVTGSLTLDSVADPDADGPGNDCDFGVTTPGKVSCALGSIGAGLSRTITFDVTVD
jgi:uncharacterized repeat protein (TIGR01451 family)